jgi:diguanylate cyclase (GGDEF)-like protein
LAIQATRDSLTKLPNRAVAIDRLDHALARCRRSGSLMAAIFIDLDRFKMINDSLGHDAGDEVLRTVATRLRATTRDADTVARLAGDEFVLISEDLTDTEEAVKVAERIVETLSQPIVLTSTEGCRDVTIGASVGIALTTGDHELASGDLLRDADVAMYRAKQRGRGRVEIFDDSLRAAIEGRLETQHGLRRAIDAGQLRVHYQPIVALDHPRVLGFEALVRWQHPTKGLLAPADFIEIAEDSGLIVPVGAHVLAEACRQAAVWRRDRADCEELHVAVNVSAAQFNHPTFVATVGAVLRETGLDPDALWLEITETSILADVKAAAGTLDAIRALGAHLAVDDFGTGYTSLTYLRQFPVEVLKVDRSFVSGLGRDREDQAIVEMIINLGHTLDLQIVAEGVETNVQLDELRRLRCTAAQGYHFGRPAPAETAWDSVEKVLAAHRDTLDAIHQ